MNTGLDTGARSRADRRLRLLCLAPSEADFELIAVHLRTVRLEAELLRVRTRGECLRALRQGWDLVLASSNAGGISCKDVVDLCRLATQPMPLILLVDEASEGAAAAAMRAGASDYLLKGNLTRLVPAMLRALDVSQALQAQRHTAEVLQRSQQRLRELTHHLQARVEVERVAIAREIHDDVGGSLTAVKFDLSWIASHAGAPDVRRRTAQALETLTHAIGASQRIMHNLRPGILEQGLVAALEWMVQRFERRSGVAAVFSSSGVDETEQWSSDVALAVYRTAQEALTNISKHARATQVQVDLTAAGGVLSLEVRDDGRGLGQDDLAKSGSYGLRGLHERANMVGGWIEVNGSERGTTLILFVPLKAARGPAEPEAVFQDTLNDPTVWGGL